MDLTFNRLQKLLEMTVVNLREVMEDSQVTSLAVVVEELKEMTRGFS
jgi:hypothetical protein